jgi:hypothetical protein
MYRIKPPVYKTHLTQQLQCPPLPVLYEILIQKHCLIHVTGSFVIIFSPVKNELGSSVSIVSDYTLDGRGSIPDRGGGFFL